MFVCLFQEHDKHLQFLMQQVFQSKQSDESAEKLASKVKSLEKDLFYYRTTSRDLRKKLGVASIAGGVGGDVTPLAVEGVKIAVMEERISSAPELEGSDRTQGNHRQKRKHRRIPSGRSKSSVDRGRGGDIEERESLPVQKTSLSDRTFTSTSNSAQTTGINEATSILAQKMESSRPQLSAHHDHMTRPARADVRQELQPHVVTKSKRELRQLR